MDASKIITYSPRFFRDTKDSTVTFTCIRNPHGFFEDRETGVRYHIYRSGQVGPEESTFALRSHFNGESIKLSKSGNAKARAVRHWNLKPLVIYASRNC